MTIEIKFCHISYHDSSWSEHKIKCDYTIWNVISGRFEMRMDKKIFRVEPGDVLLFHPGDEYSARSLGEECSFLVTFFSIYTGNGVNLVTRDDNAGLYRGKEIKKLSFEFTDRFKKYYENIKNPSLGLYADFLSFYAGLSEHFAERLPFHMNGKILAKPKLNMLTDFVLENPSKEITVSDMAEMMDMSEKYFSSYFHIHMGMTPKQYLIKCKMEYAAKLLSDREKTIKQIAGMLNFSDQYSFAKAFKNYYGEAPGNFRKSYLSGTE